MAVLSRLGAELDMEPEEVALGIFRITNAQMADLVRRATIERGYDPRQCLLAAYGGAAATHAAFYGTAVGAKTIIVPPGSTAFSAVGMLTCDIVHVAEASTALSSPFDVGAVAAAEGEWRRLEAAVLAQFEREGISAAAVETEWVARARYRRQVHTIDVGAQRSTTSTLADLQHAFERRYGEVYGERAVVPDGRIELVMLRVVGSRRRESHVFSALPPSDHDAARAHKGTRRGYFEQSGFVDVDVFDGEALEAGATVTGPAIIDRVGDTVVVPPGLRAEIDQFTVLTLTAGSPVRAEATRSA
jgi:N-methylhydantoinase A/oxoprolinase/acetone carboxylase beta subunit